MSLPWTDDRVETLKKLWLNGYSASQIASELGGISRNAVIGKVHRLKLVGRAKAPSQASAKPRKAPPQRVRPVQRPMVRGATALALQPRLEAEPEIVTLPEEVVIPFSQRVTIMELRDNLCRWPMGDPQHDDFRYCGSRKTEAAVGSYCEYHAARAFQTSFDRRR
jgi:GcrA cell cycle regulator